jgi:hypothetical protein
MSRKQLEYSCKPYGLFRITYLLLAKLIRRAILDLSGQRGSGGRHCRDR